MIMSCNLSILILCICIIIKTAHSFISPASGMKRAVSLMESEHKRRNDGLLLAFDAATTNKFSIPAIVSSLLESGDADDVESKIMEEKKGTSTRMTYAEEAQDLVSLLLGRHNRQADRGRGNSESSLSNDENMAIEGLMKSLEEAHLPFDPKTSLNGPLFVALYQKGDALPFWEKYSKIRPTGRENLKGQRYVSVKDGSDKDTYDLTNYAEFFGEAFSVQASATCRRNTDQPATINSSLPPSKPESKNFPSNIITKLSDMLSPSQSINLLNTPQDFTINVSGVSVRLLGNTVNFGIKGKGYLRVLYADPRLRIFTVPKDTSNEFINEKAGLTVAQVRVDLVDPSFLMDGE